MTDTKSPGRYYLCDRISKGSSGEVYKAINLDYHNLVAIKVQQWDHCGRNELAVLQSIQHPNIVGYIDHWIENNSLCMVMEYANTTNLYNFIQINNHLQELDAQYIFIQVSKGLSYAHAHGVCHRDIKVENILITDNGNRIVLADWGYAANINKNLTKSCGSVHYAAPEIIKGIEYKGTQIDVWSLGVVLYVMVTGKFPFNDDSVKWVMRKIVEGKLIYYPQMSKELVDLLSHILVISGDHRLKLKQILKHPWLSYGGARSVMNHRKITRASSIHRLTVDISDDIETTSATRSDYTPRSVVSESPSIHIEPDSTDSESSDRSVVEYSPSLVDPFTSTMMRAQSNVDRVAEYLRSEHKKTEHHSSSSYLSRSNSSGDQWNYIRPNPGNGCVVPPAASYESQPMPKPKSKRSWIHRVFRRFSSTRSDV